jgi:serine/threonine protein kinase
MNDGNREPQKPHFRALDQVIGRGACGEVRLAVHDSEPGKYYAMKIVDRDNLQDVGAYERDLKGVENFNALAEESEFLLKILAFLEMPSERRFGYVMELADDLHGSDPINPSNYEAQTLERLIKEHGRISADECIRILLGLTDAVCALHRGGLIHRDIKPSNVVFVKGKAKLADVGLVTKPRGSGRLSRVGTDGFIAPEVMIKGKGDERSDLYGLGKVLYCMVTGYDVDEYPKVHPDMDSWEDHKKTLELNEVVLRACANNVKNRYQSVLEMQNDLKLLENNGSIKRRKERRRKAIRFAFASTGVLALAILILGFLAWRNRQVGCEFSPISLIPISPTNGKLSLPSKVELAVAESETRTKYDTDSPNLPLEEKRKLAARILNETPAVKDAVLLYAQIQASRGLASRCGDTDTALAACQKLYDNYAICPFAWNAIQVETLIHTARSLHTAEEHRTFTEYCLRLGFRCMAMDDYAAAKKLADAALIAAQNSNDPFLVGQARFLQRDVEGGRKWFERIRKYAVKLGRNPTDREANLECGKYVCFAKNAWEVGIMYLTNGIDPSLKSVAEKESTRPSSTADRMALGDAWWDLAAKSKGNDATNYLRRARHWYLNGLSAEVDTAVKGQLRQRLQERIMKAPVEEGEIRLSINVEGGATLVLSDDEFSIRNSYVVRRVKVNSYSLGNLAPGGPETLKNWGTTRLLPEGVDFSKAVIAKRRISTQWGKINSFEREDGRLVLKLGHAPAGSATFDLVISFGRY